MSATTAADLLVRAHHLTIVLRDSHDPITLEQWERFDVTLHRALHEILGADAHYVHHRDPQYHSLLTASRTFPAALRPPADTPLTPAQAARLLNTTEKAIHRQIRTGQLIAVRDEDAIVLLARDLTQRHDITPADPTDPHPLARLSVTLGVLADQLNHARTHRQPVLDQPGEAAAATRHLLAIGRVAAARALTALPFADADRPFAIAQYCERVLDTLAGPTTVPGSLDRLRTITPNPAPVALGDRLETALDNWSRAARADLTRTVPAMTGIRLLGNQAIHLYAVTHQLLTANPGLGLDPDAATATALTTAAQAAQAADPLWGHVTTLARPTLEYATASRNLIPVLDGLTTALHQDPGEDLDTRRALADLTHATTVVADLMATTRTLPERLTRSQLLHTPKHRTTVIDLHTRRRLLTRPATLDDVTNLTHAWSSAGAAARVAAVELGYVLSVRVDHPFRALAPVERFL